MLPDGWLTPTLRQSLVTLVACARPLTLPLHVVGGVLRDYYSSVATPAPHNIDLALPCEAITLAQRFADAVRGTVVLLDEPLGVVRVVLGDGDARYEFDLNNYRAPTLDGDLAKRDFTVNAMALPIDALLRDPSGWARALCDPRQGRRDLAAGVLRAVYDETFRDDPLRILRGAALAARCGWTIDEPTQALMRAAVGGLSSVAGERIREELCKLFSTPAATPHIQLLDTLGALDVIFPEIGPCRTADQGPFHHLNVWEHSVEALAQLELTLTGDWYPPALQAYIQPYLAERLPGGHQRLAWLKLAALLHDIGKPSTRTVDETGRLWFTGHEHVGAQMIAVVADRLRCSGREREMLVRQVEAHLRPGFLSREPAITPRAIFRFFRDTQVEGPGVLLVWMADRLATRGRNVPPEEIPHQCEVIRQLLEAYFVRPAEAVHPPRLVTGHDLMQALQLPPGPKIGELLTAISEAQVDGAVHDREGALAWARQWLARAA